MKKCTVTDIQMEAIYRAIGKNVKKARQDKKVSQLSLALAIGHKAVGTVSMAELGINKKHFNVEHLIKIAQVLDVNICTFFQNITLEPNDIIRT